LLPYDFPSAKEYVMEHKKKKIYEQESKITFQHGLLALPVNL
jgi:hypothetical protein